MDDPHVEHAAHRAALASLRRINRWLGVERRLVGTIDGWLGRSAATLLDVGTGGGGLLRSVAQHVAQTAAPWRMYALDRSEFALREARSGSATGQGRFVAADARRLPFADGSFDVVVCSLLLHHFDPPDAQTLLREAARVSRCGIVIGDLDRNRLAWGLTWLATRVTSRSHIFHVDGPRSVHAAYRPAEAHRLARQAGLERCAVHSDFPFRWILTWRRAEP